MIQRGIKTIIYGNVGSEMVNEEDARKSTQLLESMKEGFGPEMIRYELEDFAIVLEATLDYVEQKCKIPRESKQLNL